ncbi:MAG: hypothetical protein JO076_13175 [Verrucomicrobia bacterium]|nr:hypothetical protein [Verrucomicrobiota bacterium]
MRSIHSKALTPLTLFFVIVSGCVFRKHVEPPPPPTYPPVPVESVQFLSQAPRSYYRLATITVQQDARKPVEQTAISAREIAAQKGANAMFATINRYITIHNGDGRRIGVRLVTYVAIIRLSR